MFDVLQVTLGTTLAAPLLLVCDNARFVGWERCRPVGISTTCIGNGVLRASCAVKGSGPLSEAAATRKASGLFRADAWPEALSGAGEKAANLLFPGQVVAFRLELCRIVPAMVR